MRRLFIILAFMAMLLSAQGMSACGPEGRLIYCSYSQTRHGGLGKTYCELVADPGITPVIHARVNQGSHFEPASRGDFEVDAAVRDSLETKLREIKVWELDGYNVEENMTGGATYRIYLEFSSGEKINATWYGHDIKDEALKAYGMIKRFFAPWMAKAEPEEEAPDGR